jgi:hypothetical protein
VERGGWRRGVAGKKENGPCIHSRERQPQGGI